MSTFKKLNSKIYQKSGPVITPDYVYWKQLGNPVLVREFGPIDYVDFSPVEPYYFAVTCSVRVQVYNPITKLVVKNISRFRESAYGGVFRDDGKLLCAGGEETNVKLFDVTSKSLLRLFKGHTAAVHRINFVYNKPHIVSFSDDKNVKIWDIPNEKNLITFSDHSDYIRAGAVSPVVPDIVLSGSYDGTVKMYDTRMENIVLGVNHGSPIESVLFLPSGGVFLTAGGTDIKIWDTFAGGKLLGSISQHHKTVTCLQLGSNNNRLLSASLDRHVKIYDISTFKVVHTLDYPNAVLSLGVSKKDDTLVAGLIDGLVCISRKEEKQKPITITKKSQPSYHYASYTHSASIDALVSEQTTEKLSKHDACLRKFQYSKALDCVLVPYVANKSPEITVTLLQELIRRRALDKALCGRDSKSILQLLRFLHKNITNYRFTRVLVDVFNLFLDIYEDNIHIMPSDVGTVLKDINILLKQEIELTQHLAALQGTMKLLLASVETETLKPTAPHNLVPSADAQKNLVITLT